jgi:hypothetical protein
MTPAEFTQAQAAADRAVAAAAELAAVAYPLPEVPYLTGMAGGERHAISREFYERARRRHGGTYTSGECGRPVLYASRYPVYAGDWPPYVRWCAECAWTVAAQERDLERQVRALVPSDEHRGILLRMIDPLIAVKAAMMIIEAAELDHHDRVGPETVRLLAAVSRHNPVLLVAEGCADGDCDCPPAAGGGRSHEAAVACRACSVQAGQEAGDEERRFLPECTIPAPCATLTALAVHAERRIAEKHRREQQLTDITGERLWMRKHAATSRGCGRISATRNRGSKSKTISSPVCVLIWTRP